MMIFKQTRRRNSTAVLFKINFSSFFLLLDAPVNDFTGISMDLHRVARQRITISCFVCQQGGHHPVSSTVGYGALGSALAAVHDALDGGIPPEKAPSSNSSQFCYKNWNFGAQKANKGRSFLDSQLAAVRFND